ncbi:MAG: BREX system P-loop protein BrxC [Gammaproteobacteria bacterium]|nr:BREX system P-loop protein BrxC [Gammaproteobacteria bacterium]
MKLKAIFKKPVGRPIEGVIKADDETSLRVEVEEYILTNEIEKRIESFLSAYTNFQGANGVWISGFFGSGKSHLLKMLALLLENRQVDDSPVIDLFMPKIEGNQLLLADVQKSVNIPSKSILFNIDQKADVISKSEVDALLSVFVKVFDQMCGYYGKQGHIAQFERDLDKRDLFEQFQSNYQSMAGIDWNQGREQALFEAGNIAKAYSKTTGEAENMAFGIIDKYREQYSVSIEDFANQVNAYIEQQPHGFRLNFFVDEVGQYIADNVKLMTNLQTIAESLATKCRGCAWIIVTAQEEMEMVIGEMGRKQANDFSKIQDRFSNRMRLTSADVAEVIQKRLLVKTSEATALLTDLYYAHSNNFKTLFDFADGSKSYRNFRDQDHFISSYPFVPYQFDLFQSSIKALSVHNAFEGQHSSVGERSMLGVFQKVVVDIEELEIGQLAAFDLMFEGIRSALKSYIQGAILQAEKHLDDTFATRLLKTLLLVKYVKDFKPTIRNLCILMLDNFNQDISALRTNIEESLNLLEQQTYIQRNGEHYEYLTNEEKDIEQEIKSTEVEQPEVSDELQKIIFDQIVRQQKIRHEESKRDYPFSRKLDDRQFGRDHEIGINVITPFHEHFENKKLLVNLSAKIPDDMLVILPPDARLMRDLLTYKQTEKYIRQNISASQVETTRHILEQKSSQNQLRYDELKAQIHSQVSNADILVAGERIESGFGEAQTRVVSGFQKLIASTYTNLGMLRSVNYTENDIAKYLQSSDSGLMGTGATSLAETELELLTSIQNNSNKGIRTTLKALLEKFERKPYGWHFAAVLCILAMLCARGKVEVRIDGNLLEENDMLERAFRNTHGHGNVLLDPQIEFTATQVRSLKEFFQDFFDTVPNSSEARSLARETGEMFQAKLEELKGSAHRKQQYPFLEALDPIIDRIRKIVGKSYSWYLEELVQQKVDLMVMKEEVIDPIHKFMNGSQKVIFDHARDLVQDQKPNLHYIEDNEVEKIQSLLNASDCYKGNGMQQLKSITDHLKKNIESRIKDETSRAVQELTGMENNLCGLQEFSRLNDDRQDEVRMHFRQTAAEIENQELIAVIRDISRKFKESTHPKLLSLITLSDQQNPSIEGSDTTGEGKDKIRNIEYIPFGSMKLNSAFDKAWLADEEDIDVFLKRLREILLNEIRNNKRIQI